MNYSTRIFTIAAITAITGCSKQPEAPQYALPVYQDVAYLQDYAVKYKFEDTSFQPRKVVADRNGIIQVLASNQLFQTHHGQFQYPGSLAPDNQYVAMADRKITDLITYQDQLVYLDNKAVLSNAWAGKLLSKHPLPLAKILCGGKDFDFMITDGKTLVYQKNSQQLWQGQTNDENILSIKYDENRNVFFYAKRKVCFLIFC